MSTNNKLLAIASGKCPKCHEGDIFQFKWWQISKFAKMNKTCQNCGVNFEVEPGFFYGAMYMSYGFSLMIMIFGGILIYNLFNDPPVLYYIIPITLVSLLFAPWNFRISRVFYLHLVSGIKFKKLAH
jgi:uncharacterized protein (DUF983 family)